MKWPEWCLVGLVASRVWCCRRHITGSVLHPPTSYPSPSSPPSDPSYVVSSSSSPSPGCRGLVSRRGRPTSPTRRLGGAAVSRASFVIVRVVNLQVVMNPSASLRAEAFFESENPDHDPFSASSHRL
ncbi:hypothetical protein B0H12DRAFT_526742 [Mycena haematopus]|nr:hypothetical protein B0H12DRAFT_526742 [Mycena haematopus]